MMEISRISAVNSNNYGSSSESRGQQSPRPQPHQDDDNRRNRTFSLFDPSSIRAPYFDRNSSMRGRSASPTRRSRSRSTSGLYSPDGSLSARSRATSASRERGRGTSRGTASLTPRSYSSSHYSSGSSRTGYGRTSFDDRWRDRSPSRLVERERPDLSRQLTSLIHVPVYRLFQPVLI